MNKPRAKMSRSQRAKQFAPFDAVVELRAALKETEKIREPKRTLSEDMEKELNQSLLNLKIDDIITVIYYNKSEEQYLQLSGKVTLIDFEKRLLTIEKSEIVIDDIYKIIEC